MNNKEIINKLKRIIKDSFVKDLVNDGSSSLTSVSPIDVFNRWYKTTESICSKDDSLISSLCLRASQSGYLCYPIGKECVYTGIKSSLKDDEISGVIFGKKEVKGDLNESLYELVKGAI